MSRDTGGHSMSDQEFLLISIVVAILFVSIVLATAHSKSRR